jgi:hypothetical protein
VYPDNDQGDFVSTVRQSNGVGYANSIADVKSELAASGKSIGYLNKSDVDSSVKVVLTVE